MRTIVAVLTLAVCAWAQETLTNEGVVKLVKSGMSEDLIQNVIRTQPAAFTLGAADLVALKEAGVSERIITAMVNKSAGATAAAATPGASGGGVVPSTRTSISDPGVYYKKNNEYFEMIAEEINWTTTGAAKSFASIGIIKKDLKGTVNGVSSRNFLSPQMEIIISPPTGLTVNDYALLPLKPTNKGVRDFQVGPVNQKSGVAKGALPFGVEKVGANLFRVVYQTPPGPGEYGIIPTKAVGGLAGTTRMFTFRLLL